MIGWIVALMIAALILWTCWCMMKAASDYDDAMGIGDENAICYTCTKHGTMECPNSSECYCKDNKPHYEQGESK